MTSRSLYEKKLTMIVKMRNVPTLKKSLNYEDQPEKEVKLSYLDD